MKRDLTSGEITISQSIYGSSIIYNKVKIHDDKYIFFQPRDSGMTPRGEIHAHGAAYHADYSLEMPETQAFFIHEMCHVWQYQNNILNIIMSVISEQFSHGFNYNAAYPYLLEADKTLTDYDIEQQASIVEDYYRVIKRGITFRQNRCQNTGTDAEKRGLLLSVLAGFIADPSLPNR